MPLAPGQVHYLKFALDLLGGILQKVAVDPEGEEAVGPTGGVVHFVGAHDLVLLALPPPPQRLLSRPALPLEHVLDCELL